MHVLDKPVRLRYAAAAAAKRRYVTLRMRWPRSSAHPKSRVLRCGGKRAVTGAAAAGFRRTTRRSKDVSRWVDDSDSGV